MLVHQVLEKVQETVSEDITVTKAAQKMLKNNKGALVIGDPKNIQGIFTERDLLRRVIAKKLSPDKVKLKDVMTKDVYAINYTEDVEIALIKMEAKKIRHLVVLDEKDVYVGIISLQDLILVVQKHLEKENNNLIKYITENNPWK